jgi:hypothetical protein
MADETPIYLLTFYLRHTSGFTIRTDKQTATDIAEQWMAYKRREWFHHYWSITLGVERVTMPPLVGGVGWGVPLNEVVAVFGRPEDPPNKDDYDHAEFRRRQLDIQELWLKIADRQQRKGEEWRDDD